MLITIGILSFKMQKCLVQFIKFRAGDVNIHKLVLCLGKINTIERRT